MTGTPPSCLGAARYLAETRDFAGTAVFVFQPAEEGLGGARAMLKDGLFQKFPCDEIYGLHNAPNKKPGRVSVFPGAAWPAPISSISASADAAATARGRTRRAIRSSSRPPSTQALQTIVSRNNHPRTPLVVSVTQIHAGSAYNVIPAEATISGTVRAFSDNARALVRKRMKEIAAGMAATYGVEVEFDARDIFTVLENHPEQTEAYADVAREIVGEENLSTAVEPVMGSEDFADMLRATPGAYCWVGHSCDKPVHNPEYTFDDAIIPVGASLMARIVEKRLSPKR